jgi:type I restriction-modification system, specificity subunit
MTNYMKMRSTVLHAIGGGWGNETSSVSTSRVAVIRGADFPAVLVGDTRGLPRRWEKDSKLPQRLLLAEDIVLEISGGTSDRPTGRSVFISQRLLDEIGIPAIPASFCKLVRIDRSVADPYFVYWCLQNMFNQGRAWNYQNRSTGIANFQFEYFLDQEEIPGFPLEEQRAIAATLGALDDKIESNTRLVKLIPEIISVYVAKELENNCSEIPVSNLAEFVNGGAYTKGASGNGRVVIRIAELNSGIGSSTVYNNIEVPDNKTARAGDILMSWSGTLGVYVWTLDEAIINQHIFKVLPKEYPSWLVFDRLNSAISEFRAIAADKATTMGHIRRDHLNSTLIEIPERAGIERLNEICGLLWRKYISTQLEINELSSLRDALLPELMSGRIRVRVMEVSG